MSLWINGQPHVLLLHGSKQRVDLGKRLDLIAPQLDAIRHVIVSRENFNHIAAHPESAAPELAISALVEDFHQLARNVLALDLLAFFQKQQHAVISLGRSQTVDAAHRSHNQNIAPLKQRLGRRKPQLVQFVVDGGFFFNVEIRRGNISLRLVVVVIRNKIFDRIVGKEAFEFVIKLRRQSLVMGHDQSRPVCCLNDLGHGVRLARPGDAEQHLVLFAIKNTASEGLNGSPLITARLVVTDESEIHTR